MNPLIIQIFILGLYLIVVISEPPPPPPPPPPSNWKVGARAQRAKPAKKWATVQAAAPQPTLARQKFERKQQQAQGNAAEELSPGIMRAVRDFREGYLIPAVNENLPLKPRVPLKSALKIAPRKSVKKWATVQAEPPAPTLARQKYDREKRNLAGNTVSTPTATVAGKYTHATTLDDATDRVLKRGKYAPQPEKVVEPTPTPWKSTLLLKRYILSLYPLLPEEYLLTFLTSLPEEYQDEKYMPENLKLSDLDETLIQLCVEFYKENFVNEELESFGWLTDRQRTQIKYILDFDTPVPPAPEAKPKWDPVKIKPPVQTTARFTENYPREPPIGNLPSTLKWYIGEVFELLPDICRNDLLTLLNKIGERKYGDEIKRESLINEKGQAEPAWTKWSEMDDEMTEASVAFYKNIDYLHYEVPRRFESNERRMEIEAYNAFKENVNGDATLKKMIEYITGFDLGGMDVGTLRSLLSELSSAHSKLLASLERNYEYHRNVAKDFPKLLEALPKVDKVDIKQWTDAIEVYLPNKDWINYISVYEADRKAYEIAVGKLEEVIGKR